MKPPSHIEAFTIERRISPAFDGRGFGTVGPYELIMARAHGSLDPEAAANAAIAELDKAPLDAEGRVAYSTAVTILRPVDLSKGSGNLVFEVVNRSLGSIDPDGMKLDRMGLLELLLGRGDIVVNAAWQGELTPAHEPATVAMMRQMLGAQSIYAQLPPALDKGRKLVRRIRFEVEAFELFTGAPVTRADLIYPAADLPDLQILSRRHEADPPAPVPAGCVRLADSWALEITPIPGAAVYDVLYNATDAVVSGIGLVVPRDLVSFLRHDRGDGALRANPLLAEDGTPAVRRAYAYGISQGGRYLREFLWLGFNADAEGRRVFDGLIPVISGGRRGSFNAVFAQPGVIPGELSGHRDTQLFPFAYPVLHDPISGRTDGLLKRCRETDTCPKIMQIDSEYEAALAYGWLMTVQPDGQPIAAQPPEIRLYAIAGGDHGGGMFRAPICRAPAPAPVPAWPFLRAALVTMDEWVRLGIAPPESRYPNLMDGTLTTVEQARANWPEIPGYPFIEVRNVPEHWVPGSKLPVTKGRYPVFTPTIDRDGNATGGVRHPLQALPTGTITGIGARKAGYAPENVCPMIGESLAFRRTRAEREAAGDPRPSLEERYPGGAPDLMTGRRAVAAKLVAERYLLPADEEAAATAPPAGF